MKDSQARDNARPAVAEWGLGAPRSGRGGAERGLVYVLEPE